MLGKSIESLEKKLLIALARKNFWDYCKLKMPKFYTEDKEYLKDLCYQLQEFMKSEEDIFVINMPPRHAKSLTAQLFVGWLLGGSPNLKIMTGSYNERLSQKFAKKVRDDISELRTENSNAIVYTDIYPDIKLKKGSQSASLWALEGHFDNYLATSPTGTATGFGANIIIIDDLIKNYEEANNATVLENHWEWFKDTMLSRLESGGKVIIIMTRWHTNDLSGKILKLQEEDTFKIRHINYKAKNENGEMLCPTILDVETFRKKISVMGEDVVSANYQQIPIDIKGKLYSEFPTYDKLPENIGQIRAYIDTADSGADYLCMIIYAVCNRQAYVLDILYTKAGMEVTEKQVAKMLYDWKVNIAHIEYNNGGKGFKRNVNSILWNEYQSNYTVLVGFYQSSNKETRILTHSGWVNRNIFFPENWKKKYREFAEDVYKYQKEGKNKHDDAPDCLTGIAEKINEVHFSFD